MKTDLRNGEAIIKQDPANLHRNIENVGGRLYLTDQRLIFEPHKFNIQSATAEVELSNVQGKRKCWTKFLGLFPVLPNSLAVLTREGKEYRFTLHGRYEWAELINAKI